MININVTFSTPFRKNGFQNLFCIGKRVSENKAMELEFLYYPKNWFVFNFNIGTKVDHAGLDFELGLFGYSLHFIFYDIRHWDDESDDYEIYEGH